MLQIYLLVLMYNNNLNNLKQIQLLPENYKKNNIIDDEYKFHIYFFRFT